LFYNIALLEALSGMEKCGGVAGILNLGSLSWKDKRALLKRFDLCLFLDWRFELGEFTDYLAAKSILR
jgi:hypothetical protein